MNASLFALKRRAVRFLGVLALCATATAVPLALGSGSPAGAIPDGGGCGNSHNVIVPRSHVPIEECK